MLCVGNGSAATFKSESSVAIHVRPSCMFKTDYPFALGIGKFKLKVCTISQAVSNCSNFCWSHKEGIVASNFSPTLWVFCNLTAQLIFCQFVTKTHLIVRNPHHQNLFR